MDSAVTAVPATPAPERASVWEDFLDIFYAPSLPGVIGALWSSLRG